MVKINAFSIQGSLATLLAACAPQLHAMPPEQPLPAPNYSFDLNSPTVLAGSVAAAAVLGLEGVIPIAATSGAALGLNNPLDELDALSGANSTIAENDTFALLFSVDAGTLGTALPDEEMIEEHLPYNATDQAERGHQAADQFMALALFTSGGTQSMEFPNNVLTRNNYDEGGTDFGALPETSAEDIVNEVLQDRVDAMGYLASGGVYFSVSSTSPSLDLLSCLEEPSGAHLLFCNPGIAEPVLFASFSDLGLQQADDLDAMLVLDRNNDGAFNDNDRVLFSLAPGSPSLIQIPGASVIAAAADIFVATPGQPPALFASAASLGLGNPDDNIDALDMWLCDEIDDCAEDHGIRAAGAEEEEDDEPDENDGEHGGTNKERSE